MGINLTVEDTQMVGSGQGWWLRGCMRLELCIGSISVQYSSRVSSHLIAQLHSYLKNSGYCRAWGDNMNICSRCHTHTSQDHGIYQAKLGLFLIDLLEM